LIFFRRAVRANGFKHILNRDGVAFVLAWRDGPTVKNQAPEYSSRGQGHGGRLEWFLSQPTRTISPSRRLAARDKLIESAITSRLISEARIPSVPIVMPSEMETVLNSRGVPPAARMPSRNVNRKLAKMVIARPDFNPGVGDANQRLGEVFILQAGGAQQWRERGRDAGHR